MLILNVMRLLEMRGIERPYSYLRKNGFVHSTAGNIINGRVLQLRVEQIEQLCLLLTCTPNDLFEWRSGGENRTIAESHPIQTLKRERQTPHISYLVKDLPVEKLDKLGAMIEELRKE